jgi:hypothetical protein
MIKIVGRMIDPTVRDCLPDLSEDEGDQEEVDDIVNRAHGYSLGDRSASQDADRFN